MNTQTQMIKYFNLARQFPSYFISIIDKQLNSFVNEKEIAITSQVLYQTNEGKIAWMEARAFLQKQSVLPPLEIHSGLNLSANDHAKDLVKHHLFGHNGSDKSTFSERILRYCKKGSGAMAQIIGADFLFNDRNSAEMTILGLIVDDGVLDRGHRKTIFSNEYRYIGCKSEIQEDKLISVFNLTQNKLLLKNQNQSSSLNKYQNNFQNGYNTFSPLKDKNYQNKQNKTSYSEGHNGFNYLSKSKPLDIGNIGLQTENKTKQNWNGKKLAQKKQNVKVYFQQGNKITQKTVIYVFMDGTTESNFEKHTTFSS